MGYKRHRNRGEIYWPTDTCVAAKSIDRYRQTDQQNTQTSNITSFAFFLTYHKTWRHFLCIEIDQEGSILCRYDTRSTQYAPIFIVAYCVGGIWWLYNASYSLKISIFHLIQYGLVASKLLLVCK